MLKCSTFHKWHEQEMKEHTRKQKVDTDCIYAGYIDLRYNMNSGS